MPRVSLNQTAFTGGEIAPSVRGRTDLDRYGQALARCRNAIPMTQGGVKRRPGFRHISDSHADAKLAEFRWNGISYVIEFRTDSTDILIHSSISSTPGLITGPFAMSGLRDWVQIDNRLILLGEFRPQALDFVTDLWLIGDLPIQQIPFAEVGFVGSSTATLSLATVGTGRTLTAASAQFQPTDVGRGVISGRGVAVITAYTSTTVVTVQITRAFSSVSLGSGNWYVEGSPQATCTPSAATPLGASITLTAGADTWRAGDVGSHVRINGGLVKITAVGSPSAATATIVRELSGTTAAPANAWSLEAPVWSDVYGWPSTGTAVNQRLVLSGQRAPSSLLGARFPRTLWGSRIGEFYDFTSGTNDADGWAFTIDSDESTPVQWLAANPDILAMTELGEYSVRGGVEKPVTPTNVRIKRESAHGADGTVRPVTCTAEVVFAQRGRKKLRSIGYRYDFDRYTSPDITVLAEHLFGSGVVSLCFTAEPQPILWASMTDGTLCSCTFDRDQQPALVAWASQSTKAGSFRQVATMRYQDRDEVFSVVTRTLAAMPTTARIERSDWSFRFVDFAGNIGPVVGVNLDAASTQYLAGPTFSTMSNLLHLIGVTVDIVLDGAYVGKGTVNGSGVLTLPRPTNHAVVGLDFRTEIELLPPEFGTGTGSAQGNSNRTGELTMRFLDTIGAKVGDGTDEQTIAFRSFGEDVLDEAPAPFTGLQRISMSGWERGDTRVLVIQDQPHPLHLLSVMRKHSSND